MKKNLGNLKMEEVLVKYEKYLNLLNKSNSTIKTYLESMSAFFKNENITSLDMFYDMDLEWYFNFIKREQKKGNSPATINKKKKQLSSFYQFLILGLGMDIQNVCKSLPSVNGVNNSHFQDKVMSKEQVKRILNVVDNIYNIGSYRSSYLNLRDKTIIYVLFDLGMRIEEVSNIKIEDLVLNENKLLIRGKGHGGNISRFNYLNDRTKNLIEELIKYNSNREYLFETKYCEKMTTKSIREVWNRVCKKADVVGFTPHKVRHTTGSNMIANGVDIDTVAMYLGHKHKATAEKFYIKPTDRLKDVKDNSLFE